MTAADFLDDMLTYCIQTLQTLCICSRFSAYVMIIADHSSAFACALIQVATALSALPISLIYH